MAASSAALAARARADSANNVLIASPQDARPSQPPPREQRPRQRPLPLGPPGMSDPPEACKVSFHARLNMSSLRCVPSVHGRRRMQRDER